MKNTREEVNSEGFSLAELLVTTTIIGILLLIGTLITYGN